MSRNQKYEAIRKAAGFVKITLWVKISAKADFLDVGRKHLENPNLVPALLRDTTTGQLHRS